MGFICWGLGQGLRDNGVYGFFFVALTPEAVSSTGL
jgi:hypothetical protein